MRLPLTTRSPHRAPDHIGEVVGAATTVYTGQCFEPDELTFPAMPALGRWVKSRDEETGNVIYGVVSHAAITPIDSVHRARALGLSAEELRRDQPQIFAMLKTDFEVTIVGFESGGGDLTTGLIYQFLPPRPPQIHQAIFNCSDQEVAHFCQQVEFLRTLLHVRTIPVDELIAAVIRQCFRAVRYDRTWLIRAGQQLSLLLRDDYDHLSAIIRKIQA